MQGVRVWPQLGGSPGAVAQAGAAGDSGPSHVGTLGTPWVNLGGVEGTERQKSSVLCNGNYFPVQTPAWWADAEHASPVLAEF